jgi:NAD(P)H-hydrate epimerase
LLEGLLLEPERPLVLDADALNIVAAGPGLDFLRRASSNERPVVLTPHPGEFARLTGSSVSEILRDAVGETRDFARATGCVVALKTASTVVAHPDGRVAINTTGNPGMATGGSGDVLTGVVAGLMAQGHGAWDACRLGVMVHGLAGDIAAQRHGERSVVAGDLVECLGEAFKRCELG